MGKLLRCKVYPGQFTGEFAVGATQINGERLSLFVPEEYVEWEQEPTRDRAVDGWIRVEIWEQTGDSALVKLPRESFESGWFVTVGLTQFREGVEHAGARP
jgi:hypothetical protein